jgi:N-acyl-D-amino-acid deacylase
MSYDLVVKNGMLIDGSGMSRYRADIGVKSGKIATIGRISEPAEETIDADGHVVTPGFVDGHTHMDAQIFWDPLGTSSCYHGVTTVVMGNCGFTLAPCREAEADFVFRNLERAEDIAREALLAGIDWRWETFPEYLDVLDTLPKGINYSGYIGHSALRTYVMGERAFENHARDDDLDTMTRHVKEALDAGAMGFSTSRSQTHKTSDDRPVASRVADWSEVETIGRAMAERNAGILQISVDVRGTPEEVKKNYGQLKTLSIETGRPVTFGMFSMRDAPSDWRYCLDLFETSAAEGARMFGQVHTRELSILLSFETRLPFDQWDVWRDIRSLSLEEQKRALGNAETKKKLIAAANRPYDGPQMIGPDARPPDWDRMFVLNKIEGPHKTMSEMARARGVDPVELMIDLALENDMKIFFRQPIANEDQDHALEMMKHPRSVVTFSDAGAHVSQIMDNSLQTHLLGHWVREKNAFTLEEAVRLITHDTATHWGFYDRGLIREGMAADMVVFDPDTVGACMPVVLADLPAGAKRLKQTSTGILATIVNGKTVLKNNIHTGAYPGRVLRGPLATA